ncbi:hypothetical protein Tco_0762088, partial [Tanacetum coccineum]
SHESVASDVNVSLKTIAGNSVSNRSSRIHSSLIPDILHSSSFPVIHLTTPMSFFFLKPDILLHSNVGCLKKTRYAVSGKVDMAYWAGVLGADECDAFDSDVDDEPTAQSIFMANLSSVGSANPHKQVPSNCIKSTKVAIYKQRAKFELTKREQRMDDQMHLAKQKAKELKANATPLPVLPPATVYPPNTSAHLFPRTLPITSQVNTGLNFLKSLVTEVRAMKAIFENLEAKVDQNETDLRSGEIERKNLLITNENLVVECLSKDVFYTATDSVTKRV